MKAFVELVQEPALIAVCTAMIMIVVVWFLADNLDL